ncbi:MAG: PhzF family phenazine biosynthesis protein [Bacteroidota bacterium]
MQIQTFIVDAFSHEPFKGNPAGVCLLDAPLSEASMQQIAAELRHSETAFIQLQPNAAGQWPIRYFTPATEVEFCGHATLASAKVIIEKLQKPEVKFLTRFNLALSARPVAAGVQMVFPLYDTVPFQVKPETWAALGIHAVANVRFNKELDMLLVEVADKATLQRIQPDFKRLRQSDDRIKELAVTTRSLDPEYDFYSRCFCPWLGIDEDPVTGAIHTVLAKYWGDQLGKQQMKAYQLSERGGYLHLTIQPDALEVTSNAHIILEGQINL